MRTFFNGLSFFTKGLQFLKSQGLGFYFLFPLVFNVLLFWAGLEITSYASSVSTQWLNDLLSSYNLSESLWGDFFYWTVWIMLRVFYFLLFAYMGGYITLVCLSPVLSVLSEHVSSKVLGVRKPFRWNVFLNNVFRGVAIATRNTFFDLLFILVFFVISFIPIVGLAAPIGAFLASAYFYGSSFVDYSLEQRQMSISQSIRYIRTHKSMAFAHGIPFSLILHIPVVGPLLAGFIAIISTTGATLHMIEKGELTS